MKAFQKCTFSLNLSHYVKSYGIWSNFGFFTMPADQIWSCHVTQEANFEDFLFCSNSTFNIRKSHKIPCGKALHFRSYQPKTSPGGGGEVENTPSPGLKGNYSTVNTKL